MKMDTFVKRFMKIQKDLALAEKEEKKRDRDDLIEPAVDAMVALSEEQGVTPYQVALLYIQITWWGQQAEYGKLVFQLCQDMRDAEPEASRGSVFKEVLAQLQAEAQEAIAYVADQVDRVRRRPRAAKWGHAWVHQDAFRPRMLPMEGRFARNGQHSKEKRSHSMNTSDDADGASHDENDTQEEHDDENYSGMDIDEEYDKGEEDNAIIEEYSEEADEFEYCNQVSISEHKKCVAAAKNSSQIGTDDSSTINEDHKMTLICNGDIVAEISDLESSLYLKAFIKYWNEDPSAWRKHIDKWEEKWALPGHTILQCLKKEDGDELQEIGEMASCMPARTGTRRSARIASMGHGR